MAFDINRFSGEMAKNGIAKTSDFEVEITGYPGENGGGAFSLSSILNDITSRVTNVAGNSVGLGNIAGSTSPSDVARSLSFRIDNITMPQRSVNIINYQTYGAPYKIGSNLNYVDIDFSVILSPDLREREFFLKWQDLIGGDQRTGTTNWDIGYYDAYICKQGFIIYQLDQNGNRTRAIKLIDSYPMMVSSITGNWAQTDIQKMNITMAYRYFVEEDAPPTPFSLTGGIENIASTVNAVRNLPAQIKGRSRAALDRAGIPRF